MSSIVYVTDNKMIEYHRLNGNTTMNFWRPSSQRSFSKFVKGDLLFFYIKDRPQQRERYIAGYGKFKELNKLSLNQMWNKYETLNGYSSKKELREAILKASKKNVIPRTMNCIYLTDVVFFQNPIYLSQFGIKISNRLESYFYLDKHDKELTSKILNLASKDGIDLWSRLAGNVDVESLEDTQLIHTVSKCIQKVNNIKYNNQQNKIAYKLMQESVGYKPIREKRLEYYKIEDNKIEIAIPFVFNNRNHDDNLKKLLGHLVLLNYYLGLKDIKYNFKIISEEKLNSEDEKIIKELIDGKL
ncbi:MAG: hypothetical protein GX368_05310 [Erysipelotrichaceae bacterium]|nr:hypothetical protein [Erysipelotrichaceae bacterium]